MKTLNLSAKQSIFLSWRPVRQHGIFCVETNFNGQEKAGRFALNKSKAPDLALVTVLPDGGAVFLK